MVTKELQLESCATKAKTKTNSYVNKRTIKIWSLCIVWYLIATLSQIIGKMILTQFPFFTTLTLTHLISTSVYSFPLLYVFKLRNSFKCVPSKIFKNFILPLCVGKVLTSLFAHLAILRIPVSFAHTIKSSVPIFTVAMSRILFGETQTLSVYLSLIPIVVGVAITTITELSFDILGLFAGFSATLGFSVQNIFNKRLMKMTKIHSFELLAILGRVSLLMVLPIWGMMDAPKLYSDYYYNASAWESKDWWRVPTFLVVDGLLNFAQNIVAFQVLSLVAPLTYSVTNSSKRIVIIVVSLIVLQNPWTYLNAVGMTLAVGGVLCYSLAKAKQNQQRKTNKAINSVHSPVSQNQIRDSNQNIELKPVTKGYLTPVKNMTKYPLTFSEKAAHIDSNFACPEEEAQTPMIQQEQKKAEESPTAFIT